MKLCNQHDARNLVTEMYSEATIYYHRGRIINDQNALSEAYSYMNSPNYQLRLDPIVIEKVTDTVVFEIGQCSGSYGGKYILVWSRDKQGEWKIALDSNL